MEKRDQNAVPLIERAERALLVLAFLIERDGDVHVPLYESLERNLETLRRAEDTKQRAKRLLLSYTRDGGLNAIRSKNLTLSDNGGPSPYLGP